MKPSILTRLGTAVLSDALRKSGAMCHELQCRSGRPVLAGPAFTVRLHPGDLLMVTPALEACPAGHVLVIDGRGFLEAAVWGELTTLAAQRKRLAGVVIDGAVRDSARLRQMAFPVFARAVTPAAGGTEYPGEMGVPVSCGGQVVAPGDQVVGDADGVVVIAAARLAEVVAEAGRIAAAERQLERAIRRGVPLGELIGAQATLAAKSAGILVPQLRQQRTVSSPGQRRTAPRRRAE